MKKLLRAIGLVVREGFWIAVAAAIVFGGIAGFQYLGEIRNVVEAEEAPRPIALVQTARLEKLEAPLPIRGEGFIKPFRQVSLSGQTGGRIIELHPAITDRGRFAEGEILARLDDSAQQASLAQTRANIAATQARLDLNETQLQRALTLRQRGVIPQEQLDQIESQKAELAATLESLEAARQSAEVALEQTVVRAPFDGAVLSKVAELGTVVNGGQAIAEIYTSDRMEIDVAVREADAALIPGLFSGSQAKAHIRVPFAGRDFEWSGRVVRVEPQLDRQTRTLTVTVELDDVRGAVGADGVEMASGAPPALINSFARVVIDGTQPEDTYRVTSTSLRNGDRLWLLRDGALAFHPATLVHVDGENSYVQVSDLSGDALVIETALSTPVEGMRLRDVAEKDDTRASLSDRFRPRAIDGVMQ